MDNIKEKLVELIEEIASADFPLCAMDKIADHLIANGVTIQKWIPVEERLPEPFVDVLVSVLKYHATGIGVELAYLTRHNEWVGVPMCCKVTHWMPLPEPPKGE